MENLRKLLKEDRRDVLTSFLLLALTLFLGSDGIALVILLLIGLMATLAILLKRRKKIENLTREIASLSFFAAFLSKMAMGKGTRQAYKEATTYLVGHFEPIPLEEISGMTMAPYALGRFAPFLLHIAKKDQANEAYLLDGRILLEEVERMEESLKALLRKDRERILFSKIALAGFLSLLLLSASLFPGLLPRTDENPIGLLSYLVLGFFLPSVYLPSLYRLGGREHA